MAKLHELLAIETNLKGQALVCRNESQATLEKKRHLFEEKLVTFTPLAEGAATETRERREIQNTVRKEVEWLSAILVKALDASYAIDIGNSQAKADIVLEEDDATYTVAKGVPATALLQLEKRVREIVDYVKAIPTLDPAKGFQSDPARGAGIYVAREVTKASTQKVQEPLVLLNPTKEHPGQVTLISKDIKVGTVLEQEWSALITPATKAELLERGEMLLRAVSKARARANLHEVDPREHKIGHKLLEYVFQPLLT